MTPISFSPASPDNKAIRETAEYTKKQGEQTETLIKLTRWIIALTIVMAILVLIEVVNLFYPLLI